MMPDCQRQFTASCDPSTRRLNHISFDIGCIEVFWAFDPCDSVVTENRRYAANWELNWQKGGWKAIAINPKFASLLFASWSQRKKLGVERFQVMSKCLWNRAIASAASAKELFCFLSLQAVFGNVLKLKKKHETERRWPNEMLWKGRFGCNLVWLNCHRYPWRQYP